MGGETEGDQDKDQCKVSDFTSVVPQTKKSPSSAKNNLLKMPSGGRKENEPSKSPSPLRPKSGGKPMRKSKSPMPRQDSGLSKSEDLSGVSLLRAQSAPQAEDGSRPKKERDSTKEWPAAKRDSIDASFDASSLCMDTE